MKLHPLFKWFGSKYLAAKRYPAPEHDILIEPFAGGAGYSLNYSDKQVIIWDTHAELQYLWNWLINDATPDLVKDIPINIPIGTDIRTLGLNQGQELLLKNWRRSVPSSGESLWMISSWGNSSGQWTANTRARVSQEILAIKHWQFKDPSLLIAMPATWFIDPPYIYNYRYQAKTPFDFDGLVKLVDSISNESLVIACEARRKKDGKIPDYLPFVDSHSSITLRKGYSSEVVYVKPVCSNATGSRIDFQSLDGRQVQNDSRQF